MAYAYTKEIRDTLPVRQVAETYGIHFNHAGYAICPFHGEKTASFKLWDTHRAHCFGCGKTADIFDITMTLFSLDFLSAAEKLNSDFALGYPIGRKSTVRERLDADRRARVLRQEAAKRREETDNWERQYHELWDRWCLYDRAKRELAPSVPGEPLHPLFIEALHKIDYIAYLLDMLPQTPLQRR